MKKRIRIKDIAEKAGVSTGTVDRVIHKRGNVSKKAKEKVMKVLEELNYEPNIIASMLAYNRIFKIATLLPNHQTDLYWAQPKLGIEKALKAVEHYGIRQEAYSFGLFDQMEFVEKMELILEDPPEALLFAPIFLQESIQLMKSCEEKKIPVVLINTNIKEGEALSYVGQDSYQTGVLAGKLLNFGLDSGDTAMLLNLGDEPANARHMVDKEKGFRDYFAKKNIKNINIIKGEFSEYVDKAGLTEFLMDQFKKASGSLKGIFVMNSRAFMIIDALKEDLLADVKIVGFDLIEPNLKYLRSDKIHFLINQNPIRQGYLGFMNLANYLLFKKEGGRDQYLPLDIVVTENVEYYLKRELEFQVLV